MKAKLEAKFFIQVFAKQKLEAEADIVNGNVTAEASATAILLPLPSLSD